MCWPSYLIAYRVKSNHKSFTSKHVAHFGEGKGIIMEKRKKMNSIWHTWHERFIPNYEDTSFPKRKKKKKKKTGFYLESFFPPQHFALVQDKFEAIFLD